jgi:hypothetical protein
MEGAACEDESTSEGAEVGGLTECRRRCPHSGGEEAEHVAAGERRGGAETGGRKEGEREGRRAGSPPPQHKGARGEERVGATLDERVGGAEQPRKEGEVDKAGRR